MSTPIWQDRRGMFQKGRELHEPAKPRRPSGGAGVAGVGGVVEAVRRASVTSSDGLEKTTSNTSTSASAASPPPRRKSSASGGLFGGLTATKRGSEDYGERRASHADHQEGSLFGGWYNKTFKGVGQPQQGAAGEEQKTQVSSETKPPSRPEVGRTESWEERWKGHVH